MKSICVYKDSNIIAGNVSHANTFFKRLFGLMSVKSLEAGCGILLEPCKQVHTYHMNFSIDVVFLTKDNIILRIENEMQPNRVTSYYKNARKILELNGGTAQSFGLKTGEKLSFWSKENNS